MKFVSFVSAMGCAASMSTQAQSQVENQQESLTDYDRATVGLDELMGDLNGQMTELHAFPNSVFFQEAVLQGLGQHIDAVNPWTNDKDAKSVPLDPRNRPVATPDQPNLLTLERTPLKQGIVVPDLASNSTPPAKEEGTLRTATMSRSATSKHEEIDDLKVSFTLPAWMAPIVRSEHPWIFRIVVILTFVCVAFAYFLSKLKRQVVF